ncbi:MAG TPA: hypothetical protein VKQ36_17170, partial [Ktedonobacterales bacterium]|nr:hypothetical protein [Ktedonobacterales bacterium]
MTETPDQSSSAKPNRYSQIVEHIFFHRYQEGARVIEFTRDDLVQTAQELGISPPKNLGDILYSFRYRGALPATIQ